MSPRAARYAVSAVFFVNGCALGGWVPHLADVQRQLGLSNHALGLALLFSALGAVTTMPFAGSLIHRAGSRSLTILGGALLCWVLPFVVRAPSLPLFCLGLYGIGVSNGQMDVAMNAHSVAVQRHFPRPILSAVHGWFSLGGFAGGAGAALAAHLGLTPTMHLALASIVLAVILLAARPSLLPNEADQGEEGPRFALPRGPLLVLGVLTLACFVTEGVVWDWASTYLRQVLHANRASAAWGFGLASSAMALTRFFGDGWRHRWGDATVIGASGGLAAIGILIAVNATSVPVSILGFVVAGFGLANTVPILFRAAGTTPGVSAGAGLAAVTTMGYSGFLGGPPIIGWVADLRSLGFALGLGAVLGLLVAVFAPGVVRRTTTPTG